jgi:hypothetical protein
MGKRQVVIVTGSREWTDRDAIARRLSRYPAGTILIHGACPTGADNMADYYGRARGFHVLPIRYLSELEKPGGPKIGGPRRNELMAMLGAVFQTFECFDVTVEAFPLAAGTGTRGCMRLAKEAGLTVWDKERKAPPNG